jgi:hypothetical protein
MTLQKIAVPTDYPVQPLKVGEHPKGETQCGNCGLRWDDDIPTSMTPAPSARCPFESFHLPEKAMTKRQTERLASLLPGGKPRWVRCYDYGERHLDRYTVVFTGRYPKVPGWYQYLCLGTDPRGYCQHGESQHTPIDVPASGLSWAGPSVGRRNHLGLRIAFSDLPPACQAVVLSDYRELWDLPE